MRIYLLALVLSVAAFPAVADEQRWVTSDRLDRKTCPAESCGTAGHLFLRESAKVLEVRNGWARITRYYDAACKGGRSEYVKFGNAECTKANGIVDGRFAEWVKLEHLSATRPPDPGAGATGTAALVSGSDDYRLHRTAFIKAAEELMARGQCAASDFKEMGGWMKSTAHRNEPVYFTYCGGMTKSNRIYLDASTGRTWR